MAFGLFLMVAGRSQAQTPPADNTQAAQDGAGGAAQAASPAATPAAGQAAPPSGGQAANLVTCSSQIGQRIQCTVDTSAGVALVRSRGAAPCLFGDTWGFDAAGIWVSDGCSGVFLVGRVAQVQ